MKHGTLQLLVPFVLQAGCLLACANLANKLAAAVGNTFGHFGEGGPSSFLFFFCLLLLFFWNIFYLFSSFLLTFCFLQPAFELFFQVIFLLTMRMMRTTMMMNLMNLMNLMITMTMKTLSSFFFDR